MKIRIPASEYCPNCSYRTKDADPATRAASPGETVKWCESCKILIYTPSK